MEEVYCLLSYGVLLGDSTKTQRRLSNFSSFHLFCAPLCAKPDSNDQKNSTIQSRVNRYVSALFRKYLLLCSAEFVIFEKWLTALSLKHHPYIFHPITLRFQYFGLDISYENWFEQCCDLVEDLNISNLSLFSPCTIFNTTALKSSILEFKTLNDSVVTSYVLQRLFSHHSQAVIFRPNDSPSPYIFAFQSSFPTILSQNIMLVG